MRRVPPPAPGFVSRLLGMAIAAIAPGAARVAVGRAQTKSRTTQLSRYDAARQDRVRRVARSGSADGDLLGDLKTLREKSRSLIRDDAHAASAIRVLVENVVGSGIRPQAAARPELTGMTQSQCDDWNTSVEQLWTEWAESNADANQCDTFDELTRLVYRTRLVDGETLAHRVPIDDQQRRIRTAWELLDADRLADPYTTPGSATRAGVELGQHGQAVAYWVLPHHPDDFQFLVGKQLGSNVPERIERIKGGFWNLLHVYRRDRPGQHRGLPVLTPSMPLFEHLHHYLDSEIIAARANANVAMFVRRPLDTRDPDVSPFESDAGRDGELVYHEFLEPGTIEYLNEGEEIQPYMPARPGSTFDAFVVRILRAICAALGLPYELVVKDVGGMNYSSARVALLEARRGFETEQSHLIATWLRPSWQTAIREAVINGQLPAHAGMVTNERAFLAARWIRAAWGWVDPTKEIDAARMACEANLSTPDIEASRAGLDVEDILEARARFFVRAREIEERNDLEPGTLTRDSAKAAQMPTPPGKPGKPESGEDEADDSDEGEEGTDDEQPEDKEQ